MALTPQNLDKVMAELVAVSRSAVSKREEAVNLARIWRGQRRALPALAAQPPVPPAPDPARRRARWRRVA